MYDVIHVAHYVTAFAEQSDDKSMLHIGYVHMPL